MKKTPKFTYRLLKSSVYIINQIRDLTNSNNMHIFLTFKDGLPHLIDGFRNNYFYKISLDNML